MAKDPLSGTGNSRVRITAAMCAALLAVAVCVAVCGCSAKAPEGEPSRPESNVSVDAETLAASQLPNEFAVFRVAAPGEDGKVHIPLDGIGVAISFFDIDVEGTTVQVLVLRDQWGKVHAAFNTCQSCTPSPKAYYTQVEGMLRCTAYGFTFRADEVGGAAGGCNPWPIPGLSVTADEISFPYASVMELQDEFARWEGETA